MKIILYSAILIFYFGIGCAQSRIRNCVQRDTSFTLHSAYNKELKNYPNIKLAAPVLQIDKAANYDIPYINRDGRKLKLDVFHDGRRNNLKPLIVMIHGGGWKSGDKTMMEPMAIALLEKGYVTANVEYRLSPEAKYPAGLLDIIVAIKWLKKNSSKYGIDTTRVALLGVSSGGQMASLLGTLNDKAFPDSHLNAKGPSSVVQAIVNIDGILAFKHPESQEGAMAAEWLGGSYEEIPEIWVEASALTHASQHTTPMLFINSQHSRFHAGRDELLNRVDLKKAFEVITIPETPHTFWLFDPWFNGVIETTDKFLKRIFESDTGLTTEKI